MGFWKKLSSLFDNSRLVKSPSLKMAVITAVAASTISFSNSPVLAKTSKLTTVYYVYMNETYLGIVSNKEIVEQLIEKKSKEVENSRADIDLQFGSQITYIPEQVFSSTANNDATIKNLENAIYLQAEATAIVIDGTPVVYLDNRETAEEVIKNLKLQYVSDKQLREMEERKATANGPLPALKENETRIVDVRLSKNVSIEQTKISPEKIVTADKAVTLLQKGTIVEKKYKVQDGDVLGAIANNHGLTLAQILTLNPGLTEETVLKLDQEVNITVPKPFVDVIVEKEINLKEAIPFKNEVVSNPSLPKGEKRDKQQGVNGLQSVNVTLTIQNGQAVKKDVSNKVILTQPTNHIIVKGTKEIPSRGDGNFSWPTVGGYVSSQMGFRWGKMHKGIDIARPSGYTIKAADNGVVVSAGWDGSYGNKIVIDHQNGYRTVYGHLSSINVRTGQTVEQGSAIGVMGATGDATGVHLHFEVYKNGSMQNPLKYIR